MAEYQIKDEGDPRKYFIIVPNLVDDMDLSVYAFRLYVHLKRVAGDKGECWQSTATLAMACKMSVGSVSKAKKELIKHQLIIVEKMISDHGEFDRHVIHIADIWQRNNDNFAPCPGQPQPVHQVNGTYSPGEQDRSPGEQDRSPSETKNNPIKKNPIKEKHLNAPNGATQGLKSFMALFGARRIKTVAQYNLLLDLERKYGTTKFLEAATWAAESGMDMGRAVHAMQTALPNWGNRKSGKNGNQGEMSTTERYKLPEVDNEAIEELRRDGRDRDEKHKNHKREVILARIAELTKGKPPDEAEIIKQRIMSMEGYPG